MVEVTGRVVNDLVHLLAELLENATSFSSPQTKVRVTGHALPDGRVLIEIHDTGIGLSPEDLADINERLASPPTVDVSVSRRMGLFVVGRLSLRHGIRIQLRPSDSGGTTALVMLPVDVTQGGAKPQPGAGNRGQQPGGAPAACSGRTRPGHGRRRYGPGRRCTAAATAARCPVPRRVRPSTPVPVWARRAAVRPAPAPRRVPARSARARAGRTSRSPAARAVRSSRSSPSNSSGPRLPRSVRRPRSRWARPTVPRPTCRAVTRTWSPRRSSSARTSTRCRRRTAARRPRTCRRPRRPRTCRRLPRCRRLRRCRSTAARSRSSRASSPAATSSSALRRRRLLSTRRHLSTRRRRRPRRPLRRPRRARGTPRATPRAPVAGTSSVPRPRRPTGSRCAGRQRADGAAPGPEPRGRVQPDLRLPRVGLVPHRSCGAHAAGARREWPGRGAAERQRPERRRRPPCRRSARSSPLRSSSTTSSSSGPAPSTRRRPRTRHSPRSRRSPRGAIRRRGGPRRTTRCGSAPTRCASPPPHGVTPSGLPRRVPKANLVPGAGAPQQAPQGGPQISRAPDDVRGRLTNLRRGIQQGRQAGTGTTDGRGFGTTHQQER